MMTTTMVVVATTVVVTVEDVTEDTTTTMMTTTVDMVDTVVATAGMAATATAITGKARLILWDSPLTTYDSGVNLSRYGTSMQDNIMYSGRNGRGRLYNNGLGRGGYYPSSFNYGYGGRYGGYYDDYW
mmetsp:Transcript_431/g.800  ORF Transcript_431/g.800 Transcript_431/m.800 type:complete len:128 (-) Transcript_431:304-687(-)